MSCGRLGGRVDEQPPVDGRRRPAARRTRCGSPPAWSMIITARAAGSSRPLVPNTLVRLGPLAFQSIGLPSGLYQLTSGSWPGLAALPVRNVPRRTFGWRRRNAIERLHEAEHLGVLLDQPPIEPADRRCPGSRRCCCRAACGGTSSPADDHRHALAQQQRGQQVLDLPLRAGRRCSCALRRAFDAVVGAVVVVVAVAVALRRWPRCACRS